MKKFFLTRFNFTLVIVFFLVEGINFAKADVSNVPNKSSNKSTNAEENKKSKSIKSSKTNSNKQSDATDESEDSSQTNEEEAEDTAATEKLDSDNNDVTEVQENPEEITKPEKQDEKMVDISDSPIIDKTTVASVTETDKPLSSTIQNTDADSHAKASLEIADNHRNQRTHFSPIESWREALRLYKEVVTSPLDISPDLKARAAINLVEMKVWSAYEKISISDKFDAFKSIIEITENKIYSADVRGWAKRHLAKLYILGDFDFEPVQAKKQALELYNEIIADSALSNETRARAMIQLAHHYVSLIFDVSDKDALEKATKLLTDVFENQDVRDGLRAEAKILLASITNPYNDSKNERRLKLLREIESDPKVPATEKAKAKERLAHYYLQNTFDIPNSQARIEAHKLFKELVAEANLTTQERISYYLQLAEHYIRVGLDLKPSDSYALALKMYHDLPSIIQLNQLQNYIYQKEMAHYCVINAFHQDPVVSKQMASKIYQGLINDATLSIQQKAEIHWILANLYITKQLDPQTGIDGKLEGLALIKRIINDPKVGYETINQFKLNLALLFERNAFDILPSRAREEARSLLMELLADSKISAVDKQQLQARLDLLNQVK